MLLKLFHLVLFFSICVCHDSEYDYTDAVIDMLLNGASREFERPDETGDGNEPVLSGGIWKCGNCNNLDSKKLVYSEINEIEEKMMADTSVDIQIAFTLPEMQCITIHSDTPGVVRRVTGACTGGALTLSVASVPYFTVNIYD